MNRVSLAAACMGLLVVGCKSQGERQQLLPAPSKKASAAAAPASSWEPPPLPDDGPIKIVGTGGPDKPWDSQSYEEKEWYMIGKVHPVMRQVFQTFNHDKYEGEKFECVPCHGEKPEERKYKMPSDHLSAVPAFGSDDWKAMENARIFKFMTKRVTPIMGTLLGKEEWNPNTGEGYSCWGCHPKAE